MELQRLVLAEKSHSQLGIAWLVSGWLAGDWKLVPGRPVSMHVFALVLP